MDPIDESNLEKNDNSDAASFLELKDFISKHLEASGEESAKKIFRPMTSGLGLDSPTLHEFENEVAPPPITERTPKPVARNIDQEGLKLKETKEIHTTVPVSPPVLPKAPEKKELKAPPIPKEKAEQPTTYANVLAEPAQPPKLTESEPVKTKPQPEPEAQKTLHYVRVPWARRLFAAVLDESFVLILWAIAIVLTLKLLTGSFLGITEDGLNILDDARFVQFAILEFAAIWFCYFALCFGVLDMTFGMWIWGFRVDFGSSAKFAKKLLRTGVSFLFYAPIIPLISLAFVGKKGKNLIDYLTATRVYRMADGNA